MDWIEERLGGVALAAVGHRVVHGGPTYGAPQLITGEMVEELRQLTPFDPEHLLEDILLTEAFHRRFTDLPQVACFDTAFHHDLPRVARLLPISRRYEALGVRRYGFHGLTYSFLIGELARLAGAAAAQGRVILAHLGNGASLAAVRDGEPVDTSMGFTPTAGVPMSTRSGDLDPGLGARICDGLGFLGIELEEKRNAANEGLISAATSRVSVRVIRTDEEWMIASTVCRVPKLGAVNKSELSQGRPTSYPIVCPRPRC